METILVIAGTLLLVILAISCYQLKMKLSNLSTKLAQSESERSYVSIQLSKIRSREAGIRQEDNKQEQGIQEVIKN